MLHVDIKKTIGNFSLEIQHTWPVGCHVIFGVNGCGKSTLLRCIAGFTPIDTGYIRFNTSLWQSTKTRIQPHLRGIGWIGQQSTLFPHLSVKQNIQLAKKHQHTAHSYDEVILDTLVIEPIINRYPSSLSSGENQRAVLAMALTNHPNILLLDEAFSHLDIFSSTIIRKQLKPLFKLLNIPIILVSHHVQDIETLADTVYWLNNGHLKQQGSADFMLKQIQKQLIQNPSG